MKTRLSVQEMLNNAARKVGLFPYRRDARGKPVPVPSRKVRPSKVAKTSGNGKPK